MSKGLVFPLSKFVASSLPREDEQGEDNDATRHDNLTVTESAVRQDRVTV